MLKPGSQRVSIWTEELATKGVIQPPQRESNANVNNVPSFMFTFDPGYHLLSMFCSDETSKKIINITFHRTTVTVQLILFMILQYLWRQSHLRLLAHIYSITVHAFIFIPWSMAVWVYFLHSIKIQFDWS